MARRVVGEARELMAAGAEGDGQAAGEPLPGGEAHLAACCAAFVDAARRFQDRMAQVTLFLACPMVVDPDCIPYSARARYGDTRSCSQT